MEELDDDWFPDDVDQIINQPQKLENAQPTKSTQAVTPTMCLFRRGKLKSEWNNSIGNWTIGSGFKNLGNTCYLNSTLQAIFHIPAFVNWLISDIVHRENCDEMSNCIICAVSKTLIASQNSKEAIEPNLIYRKLAFISDTLEPGKQQDAHEFYCDLMLSMDTSYLSRFENYKTFNEETMQTTPINQIFGFTIKTSIKCNSCSHESNTFHHMKYLPIDIEGFSTLNDALDSYFENRIIGDYTCEKCKQKGFSTKGYSLHSGPLVLCIQMKRFSLKKSKIGTLIKIPKELNLAKRLSSKPQNQQYRFVSSITHWGSSSKSGHYTAIASTTTGHFYIFDDHAEPILVAIENEFNSQSYMLFYERLGDITLHNNVSTTTIESPSSSISSTNVPKESRSLHLFAAENLAKTIGTESIKMLEAKIADVCFKSESEIATLSSAAFGQSVCVPFISATIGLTQMNQAAGISRETHNYIDAFLSEKFANIEIADVNAVIFDESMELKTNNQAKVPIKKIQMNVLDDESTVMSRFIKINHLTDEGFRKAGMWSPQDLGVSHHQIITYQQEKLFEMHFTEDNLEPFESYLKIMPEHIKQAYDELKAELKFDDGIEAFINKGETVLKNKHFPKTKDGNDFVYSLISFEIVEELKPLINRVPERVFIIAGILSMHLYKSYDGESGRTSIVIRIGDHLFSIKRVVAYVMQCKQTDLIGTDYRKYWTLYRELKSGPIINVVINVNYDRKVGEGLLFYHNTRFKSMARKVDYLNSPHNVFSALNYFTPEEVSQSALFIMKQMMQGEINSLTEKPYIWRIDEDVVNDFEAKIKLNRFKELPKTVDPKHFNETRQKLLEMPTTTSEQLRHLLLMLLTGCEMNLPAVVSAYANDKMYGKVEYSGGCNDTILSFYQGKTFDSFKEYKTLWHHEIIPYSNAFKTLKRESSDVQMNLDKEFFENYKYVKYAKICTEDGCLFKSKLKLIKNHQNEMKSQFIFEILHLVHNHPNERVKWLEFAPIETVIDEIESHITEKNINSIVDVLEKTCKLLSENASIKFEATYSYGMQSNETQSIHDRLCDTRNKLLSVPTVNIEQVKNVMLMLLSGLKKHLSANIHFYANGELYGEFRIPNINDHQLPSGIIFKEQRFKSYADFNKVYDKEVKPYMNGYPMNQKIKANSITKLHPLKGLFSYHKYPRACLVPNCPWKITFVLWTVKWNPMKSYLEISELCLEHNHPTNDIEELRNLSMKIIIESMEKCITEENIADITAVLEKTCKLLSENPSIKLEATYSYGMKYNAETQAIIDRLCDTRNKLLSVPTVNIDKLKQILLMLLSALKNDLPATVHFYANRNLYGEVTIKPVDSPQTGIVYKGQRFKSWADCKILLDRELVPYHEGYPTSGSSKTIDKARFAKSGDTEQFKAVFEVGEWYRYCIQQKCPCKYTFSLIRNSHNRMNSYYELREAKLEHNHPGDHIEIHRAKSIAEILDKLIACFLQQAVNLSSVIEVLEKSIEVLEKNIEFKYSFGNVKKEKRKSDNAERPAAKKPKKVLSEADKKFEEGYAIYNEFNFETGLEKFKEANCSDPNHSRANGFKLKAEKFEEFIGKLETLLEGTGRNWPEILKVVTETMTVDKSNIGINAELHFIRGLANSHMSLKPAAILDFDKVLRNNPNDIKSLMARGKCYAFRKEYNAAETDFENALKTTKDEEMIKKLEQILTSVRAKKNA